MIERTPNAPYQVAQITHELAKMRMEAADSSMTRVERMAYVHKHAEKAIKMIVENEEHWIRFLMAK